MELRPDRAKGWWRLDSPSSQRLIDIAAGADEPLRSALTDSELAAAARHGLLGLMALSEDPLLSGPARAPYARLAARQSAMLTVLRPLLERLAEADIPATVVKGPAVARWAYRNPGHRTFTDLDLLVPAERVDQVLRVLEADEHTVAIPPKTPKADKRNVPMVSKSGVRFTLDLHWDLFSYSQLRGCADGAVGEGWASATFEPDSPLGPLWNLPEPMLLSFLSTHALLDHRFRLILFRDLMEAADATPIDWSGYAEFSKRYGLRSTTYIAWLIAQRLTGASIPEGELSGLRPATLPVRAVEALLPTVDPVNFDGHRRHPLNLAMVLLHDNRKTRLRLAIAAPRAYPEWLKRVRPVAPVQGPDRAAATARPRDALVLHLLPLDLARGAQAYARALRDALDSRSVRHRTVTIFDAEPAALKADFELGAVPGWGRRIGFSLPAARRLNRFLRDSDPDVVILHGGEALKYAALTAPPRTKLIYYKVGAAAPQLQSKWRRALYRLFVRRTTAVVGVSEEMLSDSDVLGVNPNSTRLVIPNGRDPQRFPLRGDSEARSPVTFLFVGHLEPPKRPGVFVRLIDALRTEGLDVSGLVVGDGPLRNEVEALAGSNVEVLGSRNDVPELMANSDVFILTSVREGMPGVLIEAGMVGIPAIATDVEGVRAIIEDGVTGIVVPVDSFDALLSAAEKLANDHLLRRQMGGAARSRCMERFTLSGSTEAWRSLLDTVLGTE